MEKNVFLVVSIGSGSKVLARPSLSFANQSDALDAIGRAWAEYSGEKFSFRNDEGAQIGVRPRDLVGLTLDQGAMPEPGALEFGGQRSGEKPAWGRAVRIEDLAPMGSPRYKGILGSAFGASWTRDDPPARLELPADGYYLVWDCLSLLDHFNAISEGFARPELVSASERRAPEEFERVLASIRDAMICYGVGSDDTLKGFRLINACRKHGSLFGS